MKIKRQNVTLLLGNGPNRISHVGISWLQVLEQLAVFSGSRKVLKHSAVKPFPLLYEELALCCVRKSKLESDLKKRVAALMKGMEHNGLHGRIARLDFRHILTTNYDYCLEAAAGTIGRSNNLREEKRYNLFRRRKLNNSNIWHIHGEVDKPRTITLGHDHYVGYVNKIKSYLVWERKSKGKTFDVRHSAFMQGKTTFDADGTKHYSWIDVFLRDDIHILGFGLDYSEIDLWWLLIFKEKQKLKARKYSRSPKFGNTWFYNIYEEPMSDLALGRLSVLESVGVQIVNVLCDRGYEHAYHAALSQIKENA